MSFDPDSVAALRELAPTLTRGIVAQRHYQQAEWPALPRRRALALAHLLHWPRTRPDFIAYAVRDLPAAAPLIARNVFGCPLLTWTVRSADDRRCAERYADQMIFEGWRP
jgi:glycerophosphoryl diester phosphodiesterase